MLTSYDRSFQYSDGGLAIHAELGYPTGVCTNYDGSIIYIADKLNGRIRQVNSPLLGVQNIVKNNTSFFPNPTNGVFTLQNTENGSVVITNCLGQTIYKSIFEKGYTEINISDQPNGIYFVERIFMNNIETNELILSK